MDLRPEKKMPSKAGYNKLAKKNIIVLASLARRTLVFFGPISYNATAAAFCLVTSPLVTSPLYRFEVGYMVDMAH